MHPERPKQPVEPKFRFVVGVSIPTLEAELNSLDDDFELRQVFYAQGTGFVAVLERSSAGDTADETGARKSTHRGKRHDKG